MIVKLKDSEVECVQFTEGSIVECTEMLKRIGAPIVVWKGDHIELVLSADDRITIDKTMWILDWKIDKRWAILTHEQMTELFDVE